MLLPELKMRRDKIRVLMSQQGIDAALITCNVNLIYTYGRVVSGYLYLPLNEPARLFVKRPVTLTGEHIHAIRKPEQLPGMLEELGMPRPARLMLEGDELSFREYSRLAACFPDTEVEVHYYPFVLNNVPPFGCGSRQGLRTDTFALQGRDDRSSVLHRDRTPDAPGRMPGYFPCVRTEHGDIHGQSAGRRQCGGTFAL